VSIETLSDDNSISTALITNQRTVVGGFNTKEIVLQFFISQEFNLKRWQGIH